MMKRIYVLILFLFLLFSVQVSAQNNRSTIRISLSDGYPLTVAVNDRYFNKVGNPLTIGDLPGKRHYLEIYRYRAYQDQKGGKGELVFSGRVKIEKGQKYDAVVDVKNRKIRLKKVNSFLPVINNNSQRASEYSPIDDVAGAISIIDRSVALQELKDKVDKLENDHLKSKELGGYIKENSYNSEEVRDMTSWLLFEESKITFLKLAFTNVSDKNNYKVVFDSLTNEASRKELRDYLNQ